MWSWHLRLWAMWSVKEHETLPCIAWAGSPLPPLPHGSVPLLRYGAFKTMVLDPPPHFCNIFSSHRRVHQNLPNRRQTTFCVFGNPSGCLGRKRFFEVKFILRSDKGLRGREVWVVQRSSVVVQISGVRHAPSVWPGDDKDLSPPTGASASIERAWRARTRGRKVARVPQGQALHPRLPRAVPKAAATAASCLFAHLNQRVHPTPNDRGEGRSPSLPSAGRAMPELRPVSLRDGCVLHDFVLLPAGHPQAVSVPLEARAAQGRGAPAFSP